LIERNSYWPGIKDSALPFNFRFIKTCGADAESRREQRQERRTVRIVNEASHPNITKVQNFELQISSVDRERTTTIPG